jgi:hypothetical protein
MRELGGNMSETAVARVDFSEFEAQFTPTRREAPTHGQLRVRGWIFVALASTGLWGLIALGIAAGIHALT